MIDFSQETMEYVKQIVDNKNYELISFRDGIEIAVPSEDLQDENDIIIIKNEIIELRKQINFEEDLENDLTESQFITGWFNVFYSEMKDQIKKDTPFKIREDKLEVSGEYEAFDKKYELNIIYKGAFHKTISNDIVNYVFTIYDVSANKPFKICINTESRKLLADNSYLERIKDGISNTFSYEIENCDEDFNEEEEALEAYLDTVYELVENHILFDY